MKLLLHACCGPCSLEPVRLLRDQGFELTVFYANSNIHPRAEHDRRLAELLKWAPTQGIQVVEGAYDAENWHAFAGVMQLAGGPRSERCRRCYHLRLEEAAAYAAAHGFEALGTTLAVSPYQCFDECREELEWACAEHGLHAVWQDFRPFYPEATRRSRELGMYRQNYCGCVYSQAEAAAEREARKQAKAEAAAEREAKQARARAQHAAEQAAYDAKQQAKRAARDAVRARAKHAAAPDATNR